VESARSSGDPFSLLTSLLYDLERRCGLIKQRLARLDDPDTQPYVLGAYQEVEKIRRESAALRADPTLGQAPLRHNQFSQYRHRKQRLTIVEMYTVPFVERYSESDRHLTRLCRRLLMQVNWPIPAPLVTAFSSQYYWVPSEVEIIAAPAIETMSLLGLPDLCHELGHLLWRHYQAVLVGEFINEILTYIREQQRLIGAEQRPPALRHDFEQLSVFWQDFWVKEFVADMVATYLTGPTFGWQNVGLCAEMQKSAFTPALGETSIHPADAARHTGILAVLSLLGDTDAARRVTARWTEYLDWSGEAEPGQYAVCYPGILIQSLAAKVVAGCQRLGIRSYQAAPDWNEAPESVIDIVALVQEAWERLFHAPDSYNTWESDQIAALQSLPQQGPKPV